MSKGNTPEGKVKKLISALLDRHGVQYDMPVPAGYGKSQHDYTCCVPPHGRYLTIEAKAPGEYPTGPQRLLMIDLYNAGAACFIVSNDDGLAALDRWLTKEIADARAASGTISR